MCWRVSCVPWLRLSGLLISKCLIDEADWIVLICCNQMTWDESMTSVFSLILLITSAGRREWRDDKLHGNAIIVLLVKKQSELWADGEDLSSRSWRREFTSMLDESEICNSSCLVNGWSWHVVLPVVANCTMNNSGVVLFHKNDHTVGQLTLCEVNEVLSLAQCTSFQSSVSTNF